MPSVPRITSFIVYRAAQMTDQQLHIGEFCIAGHELQTEDWENSNSIDETMYCLDELANSGVKQ